nr:hypothetical protein [Moraxella osloensis]
MTELFISRCRKTTDFRRWISAVAVKPPTLGGGYKATCTLSAVAVKPPTLGGGYKTTHAL